MWRLGGWIVLGLSLSLCPIALIWIGIGFEAEAPQLAMTLLWFHLFLSIVAAILVMALIRSQRLCLASWLGVVVWFGVVTLLSTRVAAPSLWPPLDDPSLITQIEARLDTREFEGSFIVQPDDFPKVLRLFQDGILETTTTPWVYLGAVSITYKNGQQCNIGLFRTFQPIGAYSYSRMYRGTSDKAILNTLLECHAHTLRVQN